MGNKIRKGSTVLVSAPDDMDVFVLDTEEAAYVRETEQRLKRIVEDCQEMHRNYKKIMDKMNNPEFKALDKRIKDIEDVVRRMQ